MDFHARQYDPQLGRFLGVDPKATSGGQNIFSPYAAMGNAQESMVDPNGEQMQNSRASDPSLHFFAGAGNYQEGAFDNGTGVGANSSGGVNEGGVWNGGDPYTMGEDGAAEAANRKAAQQKWGVILGIWKAQGGGSTASNLAEDVDKNSKKGSSTNALANVGLTVNEFEKYDNGVTAGVIIDLEYSDLNSGYSNFQWVQTIWTDRPAKKGVSSPYNDPQPGDDNLPFYYTTSEMSQHTSKSGSKVTFYDNPYRRLSYGNASWRGELSLVGQKGEFYYPIITITYGFQIKNGQLSSISSPKVIRPSEFGLRSFMYQWFVKPISILNFLKK